VDDDVGKNQKLRNLNAKSITIGGECIRRDPLPLGTSSLIPERHRWQFHRCRGYWEANGKRGASQLIRFGIKWSQGSTDKEITQPKSVGKLISKERIGLD